MHSRNFGLDVIRASAITFVLVNHVLNYFIEFKRSTIIGDFSGIFGVEVFFVLSGFLIGKILLRSFGPVMTFKNVTRFYLRRWYRTLPLYYFLLILFIIIAVLATHTLNLYPLYFVFLQNFTDLRFYSISWSLAIEEWFYLLIPFIIFASYRFKFLHKRIMYFLLLLILAMISIRFAYVFFTDPTFDSVRKHAFLRFDSLLIGVLLAGIKLYWHKLYGILKHPLVACVGILGIGLVAYQYAHYYLQLSIQTPFWVKVFILPMVSTLIALVLPFVETSKIINEKIGRIGGVRHVIIWTSLLSYSLYLIHLTMFELTRDVIAKDVSPLIQTVIALVLAVVASYLLFRFIETPFMKLRERVVPSMKKDGKILNALSDKSAP